MVISLIIQNSIRCIYFIFLNALFAFLLVSKVQGRSINLHSVDGDLLKVAIVNTPDSEVLYIRNNLKFGLNFLWHSLFWEVRDAADKEYSEVAFYRYLEKPDLGYRALLPGEKVLLNYTIRRLITTHRIVKAGLYEIRVVYFDQLAKHQQAYKKKIFSNKLSIYISKNMIVEAYDDDSVSLFGKERIKK